MNTKKWLSTAVLVLIPACIGINFLGKSFAEALHLPLWLDSIGTCLAACLAGPIVGAICGAANNLIYGLTLSPISLVYALTSAAIGIVVGILANKGQMRHIKGAILTSILAGLVAVIISTPLNVIFWGGMTGNTWGDAVYAWAVAQKLPMFIASFFDEMVVDIPDKIATILIVFGIYKGLPKTLTSLYQSNDKIENLND
ncbi:ECF transporter S component [Anaeromicropila herbilytica]|uniref:Membrane protein n=1 Tax=Anaeromicropila herbilytica TaxID=2785025 RepID=A0A7R7IEW9_9FIRM|nr:ECF transporter S component [Anaeromicropila herbilytica]BCN32481.1 membrane protein [Anaeromicropila herbilytica]